MVFDSYYMDHKFLVGFSTLPKVVRGNVVVNVTNGRLNVSGEH